MKIHDVFHPNLLQKTFADPLLGQQNDLAPPIIVNNKDEWEVNNILDAQKKKERKEVGGKIQFHVKWKRYDKNKEWYNVLGFEHSKKVVNDFYNHNPTKPRQVK